MANIDVAAGGNVQAAIDSAAGGDVIRLEAGALFTANLRLPAKGNTQYITIRTNVADASLPAAGVRIDPTYSGTLARIKAIGNGLPALACNPGACYYRLLGLEFEHNISGFNNIINLGDNDSGGPSYSALDDFQLFASQPHHLDVDRCLIRGSAFLGQKRGIYVNGMHVTVQNNWIDRIMSPFQDSQAVAVMNSFGPVEVINNYLEASAENFLTGGADPAAYTSAEVATSPAPTVNSARLINFRIGNGGVQHTITSQGPLQGKRIAIRMGSGSSVHHAIVQTQVGNDISWLPAAPSLPDSGTGSDIRWGANPHGVTVRRNSIFKPQTWRDAMLATPTNASGTASTVSGNLAPGTYFYRIQAVNTAGNISGTYTSDATAQITVTLGLTGRVDLTWTGVANTEKYRVWKGPNNAPDRYFETTQTSFSDIGGVGTAATFNARGTRPIVKNLFELKSGTNVQVDSNVMDGNWVGQGADGHAWWLKVVNQTGGGRFTETSGVILEKNWVKNSDGGILFSGQEFYHGNVSKPPRMGATVLRNNVFEGITRSRILHVSNGPNPLTIDHNTLLHTNTFIDDATSYFIGDNAFTLTYTNNIQRGLSLGVRTFDNTLGGLGEGNPSLAAIGGGATFLKNVVQGRPSASYPANNFFPTDAEFQAAFTNYNGGSGGDYAIATGHAYNDAGTDGLDIGANIADVLAAIAGVVDGDAEGGTSPPAGTIVWTSFINAAAIGTGGVQRTGGSSEDTPNSSAISEQEMTASGDFFEWTVPALVKAQVGLGTNTSWEPELMEHCLRFQPDGFVEFRHGVDGTVHNFTTYVAGDVFRITRTGTTVAFSKNGGALTPSPALPSSSGAKKLDVAFWTFSGQITDANLNGNTTPLTLALTGAAGVGQVGTLGTLIVPTVPIVVTRYAYARLGGP